MVEAIDDSEMAKKSRDKIKRAEARRAFASTLFLNIMSHLWPLPINQSHLRTQNFSLFHPDQKREKFQPLKFFIKIFPFLGQNFFPFFRPADWSKFFSHFFGPKIFPFFGPKFFSLLGQQVFPDQLIGRKIFPRLFKGV